MLIMAEIIMREMYNTCPVFFAFSNYRVGFPTLHAVVSVEF